MVMDIDTFEYIITSSELEAFILELNLIKEHRPRYNIMLMDDKSYPYIYITDEEHPRILTTRSHKNPKENSLVLIPMQKQQRKRWNY